MKRMLLVVMVGLTSVIVTEAKTLVAYYSFTNNSRTLARELQSQLPDADLVEIEPAEEGLDYAANGYAIGSALISAIRNRPDDASSYPAIKAIEVDFAQYDEVVVVTPLWWSNMAAPMQTFLFQNGGEMAGKRIGLIVSSASSGISGVVSDAERLIPDGTFLTPNLWIRASQTANCRTLIADWIAATGLGTTPSGITHVGEAGQTKVSLSGDHLYVGGAFDALSLFDVRGRELLSSSDSPVDISRLQPATYVVRLRKGQAAESYKVSVR